MLSPGAVRRRAGAIVRLDGLTMGTRWSVQVVGGEAGLQAGVQRVFDGVVAEMSNWEPESGISRFNRSVVGEWQAMPARFMTVLRAGLAVAARSRGAFDPTVGALVSHWGFGPDGAAGNGAAVPEGWRAIEVGDARARRLADVQLDFSGIAKGYGVDAVAAWLRAEGYDCFLVEAGGELRGAGVKPDGEPWWVDLEGVPGLAVPVTRVALCGLSVATSGDYRRFRDQGGRRVSHSIDPRTGAPIGNGVASVSVLHESAMMADAWATAITVLGQSEGMALAMRENLAAVMVTRVGQAGVEAQSPAFSAMLSP